MRKGLFALTSLLLAAIAYIATPFVTAWWIREAIQHGNSDYLERKIEWDSVRSTLRESLTQVALGQPDGSPVRTAEAAPKPGLWQRFKTSLGKRAVNNLIDGYVNPKGLPQLFSLRKSYREISGETAKLEAMAWHERVADFWSRLQKAEFKSATVFEIAMADRNDPMRHYIGLLELRGLEWKLTELRVGVTRETALRPAADPA